MAPRPILYSETKQVILLDRDGTLNSMVIDQEMGTINSPLHPSQVEVFPWVPDALAQLCKWGYVLAIVTNQPAASKGLTTRQNLESVHERVVKECEKKGARIATSHICWHRANDLCECRKPKPGLLSDALRIHQASVNGSWIVGDGVSDIEAGKKLGIKTAFLGPVRCDMCKVLSDLELAPDFHGENLLKFTDHLAHG